MFATVQSKFEVAFKSQKGEALVDALSESFGSTEEFLKALANFQNLVNKQESWAICKNVQEVFAFFEKSKSFRHDSIQGLIFSMTASEYILLLINLLCAITDVENFKVEYRHDVNFVIMEKVAAEAIKSGNSEVDIFNSITSTLFKLQTAICAATNNPSFFESISKKLFLGLITAGIAFNPKANTN